MAERDSGVGGISLTRDTQPVKVNLYILPTYQWKLSYRDRADPD